MLDATQIWGPYIRVYIKAFVCNPGYPGLPTAGVTNVFVVCCWLLVTPGVGNPGLGLIRRRRPE